MRKIALGCDHGGLDIKNAVRDYLESQKIAYTDFGTFNTDSVDYPEYALKVADVVASGDYESGIICCGTGIGVSMVANKVKGIRAAVVTDEFCAEMTRRHNNANVLCMGGRVIDSVKAVKLAEIFLNTEFDGGRHEARVQMITDIENR